MAGPHKRTRSDTTNHDEITTTTTPRTTRRQAQAQAQAQALTITPPSPNPSTGPNTPSLSLGDQLQTRPPTTTPSRSNTTPLHRTTSLFTRRTNNSSHNATPFTPFTFGSNGLSGSPSPGTSIGSTSGGRGQVGMLTRTQSVPSLMASPSQMKMMSSGAGGPGGVGDKGEGPSDYFGLGGRKSGNGRGKENIPPSENGNGDGAGSTSSSRKRLRVGRSNRGRSGSVSSLRSETPSTSGRPSLGPSSSFSRASMTSRLPSPAPSTQSSTPTQPSFDSASVATSSVDAIDLVSVMGEGDDTDQDDDEMEFDNDKTPTKKPRARSARYQMPTPPLSSPTEMTDAVKRMELVRMQSDASINSIATESSITSATSDDTRPSNPYKYLKSFLRLSSSSASDETDRIIVGRAPEKHVLKQYLASQEAEVGMYISGPPGTGKTALVTAMGRDLRFGRQDGQGQAWNVVEVGCMGLKPVDMWKRLAEGLACGGSESEVKAHIQSANNTLIILDEIDSLLPPPPALPPAATSHLLSKLFALPLLSSSARSIKLIAISNTLDLTIRARIALPDNHQPRVLPFKAYGAVEMSDIMLARIASASASMSGGQTDESTVKVDTRAVELLTRKVEATNGDLRNCLGCLTSAVTLAEMEWIKKPTGSVLVKVSLPHTIKAFNSHTQQLKAAAGSGSSGNNATTATGKKVKSVPLQGKMVLVSIIVWIARTRAGLPGLPTSSSPTATPTKSGEWLTTSNLFTTYTTLLSHRSSPFPPSHESDYRDLLSNLEVLGLVKLQSMGKKGSKVELCVGEQEVKQALGLGLGLAEGGSGMKAGGMADDEVRKVYEREDQKIKLALSKAERNAAVILLGEEL